jgi:hypothetical protein
MLAWGYQLELVHKPSDGFLEPSTIRFEIWSCFNQACHWSRDNNSVLIDMGFVTQTLLNVIPWFCEISLYVSMWSANSMTSRHPGYSSPVSYA